MTVNNNWKLVAYLKDQLSRTGTDKNSGLLFLNKEWFNVLRKAAVVPSVSKLVSDSSKSEGLQRVNRVLSNTVVELPVRINDLKLKFSQKSEETEDEKRKWKSRQSNLPQLSIIARTKHALNSIMAAESVDSRLQRLETLIEHLFEYPDSVSTALKNGAIPKLNLLRQNNKEENVEEALREALTMLGYTDPLPKQGIRILSIDGGGIRGILVLEMLQKLEELTGSKVHEMFDYISGVSTGSIIALSVGACGKTTTEVLKNYRELSTKVFTQNFLFGARCFLWNHGYYDTGLWEDLLKKHLGLTSLIKTTRRKGCPKISAVSTIVQDDKVTPFLFRNYELPHRVKSQYPGSYKYKLWEAARASAAAPAYFEEFRLGDYLHQDGGILVNNPTAVAIHEARQLWPNRPIQCVVSFGTGRTVSNLKEKKPVAKQTSWWEKCYNILVSATDTEAVHLLLNDLLPPSVYFRFNPYLTEMLSMDEHQPEKLEALQKDAQMYIRRNEEKFQEASNALMKEKTYYQKIDDWATLMALIYSKKN